MKNKRSAFADVGNKRWDKDIYIFDLFKICKEVEDLRSRGELSLLLSLRIKKVKAETFRSSRE
jgi:hypothetical protein